MPNTKVLQLAFNGGEVSPEMYGRVDQRDNQAGLRTCKNMYIKPQGPVKKRPGLEYIMDAVSTTAKSRLVTFQSSPQTVIEVTANTFRFIRNGAPLTVSNIPTYFSSKSCTVSNSTGIFTLSSGTLGDLAENTPVHVYQNTSYVPGQSFTAASQWQPIVQAYGQVSGSGVGTTWNFVIGIANTYWIETYAPHNLRSNDAVIFSNPSGTDYRYYYVDPIDANKFRLRTGYQGSAIMTLVQHQNVILYFGQANIPLYRAVTPSAASAVTAHWYIRRIAGSDTTFRLASSTTAAGITSLYQSFAPTLTLARFYVPGAQVYDTPAALPGSGTYTTTGYVASASDVLANWVNYPISTPTTWQFNSSGSGSTPVTVTHAQNYTDDELAQLTYAQLNNKITFAHRNKPTVILTYTNDSSWLCTTASYAPPLAAPSGVVGIPYGAVYSLVNKVANTRDFCLGREGILQTAVSSFVPGDNIKFGNYVSGGTAIENDFVSKCKNRVFTVTVSQLSNNELYISLKANGQSNTGTNIGSYQYYYGETVSITSASFPSGNQPNLTLWPDDSSSSNQYVITAIDADGLESQPSSIVTIDNNLYARETYNVLTWAQVTGAVRYNVYKKQTGLFGYIGQTDASAGVSFRDDNITPQLDKSPPILDTSLSQANAYPGAVAYFEQRKVLAGTTANPAKIWMTRSNTEQDLSYSLPIKDTDRIAFQVAAKDINVIRHIVSTSELLALTDQAEWRVTAVNSDAITPATVSVRPQSYVGASYVTPQIVNNAVVYEAARGGHVRQLGFNFNAQGYTTTDISLKAAHLFDDYTLVDMANMRSPLPILWMVSSNGKLLGLTYIPEEQVACWHQHETDGVFESVACIQEGTVDSLYAVVRRTVNGQTKRYIERMTDVRSTGASSNYLDSSLSGDGTHTGTNTLRLSQYQNQGWNAGATIQITESILVSIFALTDLDDQLELTASDGTKHRVQVLSRTNGYTVLAKVLTDLPSSLWDATVTSWAWARDVFGGLTHLAAKTVGVIADGEYIGDFTVSATGTVSLPVYAVTATIGLKYTAELKTLPMAMQIEAAGQGRTKNVNKIWVRIENQDEFQVGPDANNLVSSGTLSAEETNEELQVTLLPSWGQDGSIVLQQPDPVPLTVNGIALEVAIGS